MLLTKTEYAVHRGVNKAYISKKNIKALLEPAMETDPADGKIKVNVEKADKILNENTDTKRQQKPLTPPAAEESSEDNSYEATRRKHEQIKLESAQLDLEQKKGNLLFKDDVERAISAAGQQIREHLTLRNRAIADKAASMTDAKAIKSMLADDDRRMLETVSNDIIRKLYPEGGGE